MFVEPPGLKDKLDFIDAGGSGKLPDLVHAEGDVVGSLFLAGGTVVVEQHLVVSFQQGEVGVMPFDDGRCRMSPCLADGTDV